MFVRAHSMAGALVTRTCHILLLLRSYDEHTDVQTLIFDVLALGSKSALAVAGSFARCMHLRAGLLLPSHGSKISTVKMAWCAISHHYAQYNQSEVCASGASHAGALLTLHLTHRCSNPNTHASSCRDLCHETIWKLTPCFGEGQLSVQNNMLSMTMAYSNRLAVRMCNRTSRESAHCQGP
jgi:hypothetical protein